MNMVGAHRPQLMGSDLRHILYSYSVETQSECLVLAISGIFRGL